jgi:hypothetical protein
MERGDVGGRWSLVVGRCWAALLSRPFYREKELHHLVPATRWPPRGRPLAPIAFHLFDFPRCQGTAFKTFANVLPQLLQLGCPQPVLLLHQAQGLADNLARRVATGSFGRECRDDIDGAGLRNCGAFFWDVILSRRLRAAKRKAKDLCISQGICLDGTGHTSLRSSLSIQDLWRRSAPSS